MIKDIIKHNKVYLVCSECGAEQQMLQYYFDERYKSAMIDNQKSMHGIEAFVTQHKLCKPSSVQLELLTAQDLTIKKDKG